MNNKYNNEIIEITNQIEKVGDVWELYYQRGFLYYLANEDDKAKQDYKKAVACGLDFTEHPYYSFSNSNEKRREFLLPEKILVVLILIIVGISLFYQICSAYFKIKGIF